MEIDEKYLEAKKRLLQRFMHNKKSDRIFKRLQDSTNFESLVDILEDDWWGFVASKCLMTDTFNKYKKEFASYSIYADPDKPMKSGYFFLFKHKEFTIKDSYVAAIFNSKAYVENCKVFATDQSIVTAKNSIITANIGAKIYAYDKSKIRAYDASEIYISQNCEILFKGNKATVTETK